MTVRYAIYTEVNARFQAIVIGVGGPINYISAEEGAPRDTAPGDFARAWELWKKESARKISAIKQWHQHSHLFCSTFAVRLYDQFGRLRRVMRPDRGTGSRNRGA